MASAQLQPAGTGVPRRVRGVVLLQRAAGEPAERYLILACRHLVPEAEGGGRGRRRGQALRVLGKPAQVRRCSACTRLHSPITVTAVAPEAELAALAAPLEEGRDG